MAVRLTRTIVAVLLLVGGQVGADDREQTLSPAQEMAQTKLREAVAAFGKQLDKCERQEAVIEPDALAGVELTQHQLRLTLQYFHLRALNACTADEARDYLLATYLARESGLKGKLEVQLQKAVNLESGFMFPYWDELKAKAEYEAAVPTSVRQALEKVEALQQPFDMIESAKRLGFFDE